MHFFLEWKSWKIFLFIIVIPFGVQSLLMNTLVSSTEINNEVVFTVMPLVMLVFMAVYLMWFWTLGVELNKMVPESDRPKVSRFKFGIRFTAIYMLLFQAFIVSTTNGVSFDLAMPVIFILHMAAMYFMFYSIFFISKNLVTYENMVSGTSKSSKGTFLLLWFFPLGVWFLQPRINKIYAAEKSI